MEDKFTPTHLSDIISSDAATKDHGHCQQCYNGRCFSVLLDGSTTCPVVKCTLECGVYLHYCKLNEHLAVICCNALVPCINRLYGCPFEIVRRKMGEHLSQCPASVVTCSHEWNRWKKSTSATTEKDCSVLDRTMSEIDSEVTSTILDVSLAVRDQHLLDSSLHMPKKLKRSLCNAFTLNYPAMPFSQRLSSLTMTEDYNGGSTENTLDFLDDDNECEHLTPGPSTHVVHQVVHCSLCKARSKEASEGLASSINKALAKMAIYYDNKPNSDLSNVSFRDPALSAVSADPVASIHQLTRRLQPKVQLQMEMLNSFRSKPKQMLTFLCAQDFRRDQFQSHYKNVHCDIQPGLDGWLQIRCPLSTYGCTYTMQRFVTSNGLPIIFNPVTESFSPLYHVSDVGESESDTTCKTPESEGDTLESAQSALQSLPNEVILIILSYLDSQSLKNISLVSKDLRNLCLSLLHKRGIVVLDWRKQQGKWRVFQNVWSFSTAFYPVDGWKFSEHQSVANHMNNCPLFERLVTTYERFRYET